MAKEKNYLVHLHYRRTSQRRSENPKAKKDERFVTSVETWDTILPLSAKDDDAVRKVVKSFTSKQSEHGRGSDISIDGLWEVVRRVPVEI